ncbi:hypothetical protein HPP92_017718 [Vanilla planifolia]|uniref:Uncharacterized protein n=1 Tax=Vanilla planifolia TaxID=51239 RepID=A0A835QCX3_VANPL|nr:hypothetical protein HPP92_017718 [Vanilla planifolia]
METLTKTMPRLAWTELSPMDEHATESLIRKFSGVHLSAVGLFLCLNNTCKINALPDGVIHGSDPRNDTHFGAKIDLVRTDALLVMVNEGVQVRELVNCVQYMRILSPQEVQQMSLDGDLGNGIFCQIGDQNSYNHLMLYTRIWFTFPLT